MQIKPCVYGQFSWDQIRRTHFIFKYTSNLEQDVPTQANMDVGLRKSDNTRRWRSSKTTILPSRSPTLNYALPIKVTFALQCTSLTFFLHAFSLSFHLRFAWCYTPWFSIARLCMLSVRTSTRYPFQTTLCKATDQVDLDIWCRRGAWNSPLAWSIGAGLRTTICSLVPIKKDTIYTISTIH
jgi:hypothetical protein